MKSGFAPRNVLEGLMKRNIFKRMVSLCLTLVFLLALIAFIIPMLQIRLLDPVKIIKTKE